MKYIYTSLLLLTFYLVSYGQPGSRIGHIDMNTILQALPEVDSLQAVLKKESNEMASVYEEMQVDYNNLVNDYQSGLSTFSSLERKTREDEIIDKQKRMSEFEQNANLTLQQRNRELMQPVYTRIDQAIRRIATREGLEYVLDLSTGTVVFTSDDSRDINQEVIDEVQSGQ